MNINELKKGMKFKFRNIPDIFTIEKITHNKTTTKVTTTSGNYFTRPRESSLKEITVWSEEEILHIG